MKKHYKKIHKTKEPAIDVLINYQEHDDGKVALSAYAIDSKGNYPLGKKETKKTRVNSAAEIPAAEAILIARVLKLHAPKKKSAVGVSEETLGTPFTSAFDSLSEDDRQAICVSEWRASSTRHNRLTYFRYQILPILDGFGLDISDEDISSIPDMLATKASEHGRSLNDKKFSKHGSVRQRVQDFNRMYPRFQALLTDLDIPNIAIPEVLGGRLPQREQIKSIPEDVRVKFSALLWRLVPHGFTMGAVLMMAGLMRTSEACAPYFSEIFISEDQMYATYDLKLQIKNGERVSALKNESSYRRIILPKFAVDCLLARQQHLLEQGYTVEQIEKMFVVSAPNNPRKVGDPSRLSEFVRDLLLNVGVSKEQLAYWEALMQSEPDELEDGTVILDFAAYFLRRYGCTLLVNVCGLNPFLVDVLMGHKIPDEHKRKWSLYMRDPDQYPIIAQAMERVIYMVDHSANPKFMNTPMPADCSVLQSTVDQAGYSLNIDCGNHKETVELTVTGREPGQPIMIRVPKKIAKHIRTIPAQPNFSGETPAIGKVQSREYYQELEEIANRIDVQRIEQEAKNYGKK